MMYQLFLLSILVSLCIGDVYMHSPRGSNNRLNEKSANRNNGNRLFDSQNNNRGGYNAGDLHNTNGFNTYGDDNVEARSRQLYDTEGVKNIHFDAGSGDRLQYEALYKEGSVMTVSWTAQHGCGNNKNNCNVIVDWTCDTHDDLDSITQVDGQRITLKNGLNTGTPADPNGLQGVEATFANNNQNDRGRHESEEYYAMCKLRKRNTGLFTADQKLHGGAQINTRQNPGGTRRGLECPEERDYYPWNYPTPWRTAAIFHNNVEECETRMADESMHAKPKCACIPAQAGTNALNQNNNDIVKHDNQDDCEDADGVWDCHDYMVLGKPPCVPVKWSQVNNLGNVDGSAEGGLPQMYNLTLPTVEDMMKSGCKGYLWGRSNQGGAGTWQYGTHVNDVSGTPAQKEEQATKYVRMVMRIRYNMTTGDYDPYLTDHKCNQNSKLRRQSPIQQNPTVDIGVEMQGLRLAINTAQTGRTFQDRTHVFRVTQKTNEAKALINGKKVHNLIVQGKRGNIVQTFPAVEYDFFPKTLYAKEGECIEFQWEGSNTHNNGNPAGDGQAGDAGEGRGGSDRHNMAQLISEDLTYPMPWDVADFNDMEFFSKTDCQTLKGDPISSDLYSDPAGGPQGLERSAQLYLMSGGFYDDMAGIKGMQDLNIDGSTELDPLLNNVPASMRPMMCCLKANSAGKYIFTNTRNNNFSNRDQKLRIIVSPN